MSEVLQTNIFFFITSVAVVVVTILLIVVLIYILLIVRNVKDITDRLRAGSELIASDMAALRERLQKAGVRMQTLGSLFADKFFSRGRRTARRSAKKNEESGE